jgi:hypothetical protein
VALLVALLVPVPFIAIIPIGQIQLPRVDSYIPVVDTVMLVNDSIAATLLFAPILRNASLVAAAGPNGSLRSFSNRSEGVLVMRGGA